MRCEPGLARKALDPSYAPLIQYRYGPLDGCRRRWQSNGGATDVRSTGVVEARAGVAGAPMQGLEAERRVVRCRRWGAGVRGERRRRRRGETFIQRAPWDGGVLPAVDSVCVGVGQLVLVFVVAGWLVGWLAEQNNRKCSSRQTAR